MSKSTSYAYCQSTDINCPFQLLKTLTFPEGNSVAYTYDARGNVTSTTRVGKPGSGVANIVTTATYAANCDSSNQRYCNKPTSETDARGQTTDYSYESTYGGLVSATRPADANGIRPQTRISYNTFQAYYKNSGGSIVASGTNIALPVQISECRTLASCANGSDERKTVISYGPQTSGTGNNLSAISTTTMRGDGALPETTATTYDDYGRVQTVDGPLGADTSRVRYNLAGQVIGKVGPDPDDSGISKYPALRYSYDSWGHAYLTETGTTNGLTDSDLNAMTVVSSALTEFDSYGRPIRQRARDSSGNSLQVVDTVYDTVSRVQCSILRMDLGNLGSPSAGCGTIQSGGANGPDRVTYNSYDLLGRVWKVTSGYASGAPVDDQTVMSFSDNGQPLSVKDAENNLTAYVYDGHDRRIKTYYPNPNKGSIDSNGSDREEVGYDPNGNVTSFRTRAAETLTYSYDNLNRLLVKYVPERSGLSSTHTRDVYFEYDLFGNMTKARFDSLSGDGVTNGYDGLGRQSSATLGMDGVNYVLGYSYDAANNRSTITYPDGNYFQGYRWGSGALSWIGINASGPLFHMPFETQGRLNAVHRWNTTAADWSLYTYYNSFDGLSRVASYIQEFAGTSYDSSTAFTYGPSGQITSATRSNDAFAWSGQVNTDRNYTSNGINEYTSVGGTNFSYDGNANLTSDGTNSFVYDVENRLVSRSGGGTNATLRYDPLGRLYEVNGSATGITRFLHDGSALVAEYNGSGTMLRRYVHGPGVDQPLVWFEGSGLADSARRYLYSDERSSVIAVTDSAGNMQSVNSYDEYGIPGSGNLGRFQYTGQAWIPELGMYYYKARMYSPTLGRFMQTDPIGYGDGMNMYAYVANDPVNAIDPSGLDGCGPVPADAIPVCAPTEGYIRLGGAGGSPTSAGYNSAMSGVPLGCEDSACRQKLAEWFAKKEKEIAKALTDWHYKRNVNNHPPTTKSEAITQGWIKQSDAKSLYHRFGPNGAKNEKYLSPDGRQEAVYDGKGNLVTSPENMGTYNYSAPEGVLGNLGHVVKDIIPYWILGNTPSDSTSAWQRIWGP